MLYRYLNPNELWPFGLDKGRAPQFVALALLIFGVLAPLDAPVTLWVAGLPEIVRAPFYIITRAGKSVWNLLPTLLVAIGAGIAARYWLHGTAKVKARTVASVSAFLFAGVAAPGLVANLVKRGLGRSRPVNFEENGVFLFDPVFNDWTFQSFPSGDTTTIFAFAMVVLFFFPRAFWWMLFGAALVGLSRIMVGVHFPTDVFGGVLLGILGAYWVRNFCLKRDWLFRQDSEGKIVPNLCWPAGDKRVL